MVWLNGISIRAKFTNAIVCYEIYVHIFKIFPDSQMLCQQRTKVFLFAYSSLFIHSQSLKKHILDSKLVLKQINPPVTDPLSLELVKWDDKLARGPALALLLALARWHEGEL